MGIKNLNRYLLKNCGNRSIHTIRLIELRNQTVVIDTSIYIYKYLAEDKLLENFQNLINSFVKNQIKPIFVFDGEPPIEKKKLLKQRQENKKIAELKYNQLITSKSNNSMRLDNLKKQFLRVTDSDINNLKLLMKKNNVEIIEAVGESDSLCVTYVKNKLAWACLSDDMDLFVYGCNRVLRELSLLNDNVKLYLLPEILYDLKMPFQSFRDILVISGTDYNISENDNVCLHETLKWYKWYKIYFSNLKNEYQSIPPLTFYNWLWENTKYIKDYDQLLKVHKIFDI